MLQNITKSYKIAGRRPKTQMSTSKVEDSTQNSKIINDIVVLENNSMIHSAAKEENDERPKLVIGQPGG